MIDAKRLAELMTPEKLRELAANFGSMQEEAKGCSFNAWQKRDIFACAAAVLRKVAEREEGKPTITPADPDVVVSVNGEVAPCEPADVSLSVVAECCGNCIFWKSYDVESAPKAGICRKRPPVVAVNDEGPGTDWPQLEADEWCGEHGLRRPVADAKVIEVDLDAPAECIFCDYEQGFCHADDDSPHVCRSCVQGSASDPANAHAPSWCPARGRVIVKAKA